MSWPELFKAMTTKLCHGLSYSKQLLLEYVSGGAIQRNHHLNLSMAVPFKVFTTGICQRLNFKKNHYWNLSMAKLFK